MELHLDRHLTERRLFPAIDIKRSGTRKEELILPEEELETMWDLRQDISNQNSTRVMDTLIKQLNNTDTNKELLQVLQKVLKK
jgi:transcription termination factor Rho